jgi:cytochrome c553
MSHRPLLAACLLLLGCPSKPASPPAPAPAPKPAPAPAVEPDCTLETALVPGVPGSPGHLLPSDLNPNGASELAALMRTMVADWRAVKTSLEADAGVAPGTKHHPVHRKMRCAWPTDPKDRDATFDGLAASYLATVKAFDAAPSRETYGAVIGACAACHEVTCGGPLEVIEGLKLR